MRPNLGNWNSCQSLKLPQEIWKIDMECNKHGTKRFRMIYAQQSKCDLNNNKKEGVNSSNAVQEFCF